MTADIVARARETATIIRGLPGIARRVREAKSWPMDGEIREEMNPTKIRIDFIDVASYIGRHYTPDHKDQIVFDVGRVADGATAFIEQIEHCTHRYNRETVKICMSNVAHFLVLCMVISTKIDQYAYEIERSNKSVKPTENPVQTRSISTPELALDITNPPARKVVWKVAILNLCLATYDHTKSQQHGITYDDIHNLTRDDLADKFGCAHGLLSKTNWWKQNRRRRCNKKPTAIGVDIAVEREAEIEAKRIERLKRNSDIDDNTKRIKKVI